MSCVLSSSLCSLLLMATLVFTIQTLGHPIRSVIAKNCAELYKAGNTTSGVYKIDPDGAGAFEVFCNQTTAGGGWTVFQKRLNGSVDFNRSWCDYKHGFGNLGGEFWLGLDKINRLTWRTKNKLRVDLDIIEGGSVKSYFAEYDLFAVETELKNYALSVGSHTKGATQNVFGQNNNASFSTMDKDHDGITGKHCAKQLLGGWWYQGETRMTCGKSNLNGIYYPNGTAPGNDSGIQWDSWGPKTSATKAEMKIKPDCTAH